MQALIRCHLMYCILFVCFTASACYLLTCITFREDNGSVDNFNLLCNSQLVSFHTQGEAFKSIFNQIPLRMLVDAFCLLHFTENAWKLRNKYWVYFHREICIQCSFSQTRKSQVRWTFNPSVRIRTIRTWRLSCTF